MFKSPMSITPLIPSLFAWGRVTWVKSQWKLSTYPGHFSVEINSLETMEKANHIQRRMLEAAARRPPDRDALAERLRDGRF